jgi:holliday junction resolvase Hjr
LNNNIQTIKIPLAIYTFMKQKAKGSNAERELVGMFWKTKDWSCVRVAGSGSARHPLPDLLAGNILRRLAIECKATKDGRKYFTGREISQLKQFSERFGAESWLGIRFDYEKWYFITIDDLNESGRGFSITLDQAKSRGFIFEELIGRFTQKKLND